MSVLGSSTRVTSIVLRGKFIVQRNMLRLFVAGLMSSVFITGCATVDEDFNDAVDTSSAPLRGDTAKSIPDEYIVVFKAEVVDCKGVATAINRISLRKQSTPLASSVHRERGLSKLVVFG
jgi:hypothetical protein